MYDNLGIFMRFHKRHGLIGDEIGPIDEHYLDHKDFNGWYSVKRVTKRIIEIARKVLIAEIEDYDRWIRGECCSENE
jgi:hypothetical protein